MKHLKLLPKVILAFLITLTIVSCKKDKDEPAPPVSGLSFVNASPDAPSVNLYVDQNKVNNDLFSYGDHLDYLNARSGNREVFAYEGSEKKVSGEITMEEGKMYSLFLTGKWDDAEFVLLEDTLKQPETGKAHIRFLNMSSDAPALDLGLTDGSTLISEKEYKKNSGFIEVEGDTKYNFVIRNHAATQDTVGLTAMTLEAGHIYTIWANGLKAGTGATSLGGEIIKNY
jgi:hypothetical protein